jgi:hypothetical protein
MFIQLPKSDRSVARFRLGTAARYFSAAWGGIAATTLALPSARLYAIPFFCPTTFKMGQIDINVTTLSAGNARLGIYEDNGKCAPGKLLLDAGEVATGTTGVKGITITKILRGGKLYWLALVCAATPTIRALAVGSNLSIFFGLDSTLGTAWGTYYYRAFTYAALPDPWGTPTIATGIMPAIFMRKDNLS